MDREWPSSPGSYLVDLSGMTLKFLSKHAMTADCPHESQMRLEVAGMSRDVCEACGKVSVGYLANHLKSDRSQEVREAIRSFGSRSDD